ncbi:MAG TPA: hypothetical protein VMK65_04415 [Longimicrobiales bacterium]|nr:hypothetical protein [Longimicrobiales bacterium]
MADRDTREFLAAFAVGAVLGIGATLLMRPDAPTARERLTRELKDYGKRAGKTARRARKGMGRGLEDARERGGQAVAGGVDMVDDLRDEVSDIVSSARQEITRAVETQVKDVEKALKRLRQS